MDTDTYPYVKLRKQFGHQYKKSKSIKMSFIGHLPNPIEDKERGFNSEEVYVRRDPNFKTFSNIPQMSENIVSPNRASNFLGEHRESQHQW